jgi:hypothetical protein
MLLSDGLSVIALDRTVSGGRTGMALLAVPFWMNPPLAAAPELPEPGRWRLAAFQIWNVSGRLEVD